MGGAQSQEEPTPSEADTPGIYEIAELEPRQWPIVYSSQYNIGFMGLQRLHPFDSAKWGKIFDHLQGAWSPTTRARTARSQIEPRACDIGWWLVSSPVRLDRGLFYGL
jgi:hypothetical protein